MDKLGRKDFKGWIKVKEKTHYGKSQRSFKTGDIWWCKIGENVGSEICGKGKDFLRPVLVIKKLSKENFIGVPLTSKRHVGTWYVPFVFKDITEYAVISQIENISAYRLTYKMGMVPNLDLRAIIDGLIDLVEMKK
ncbi:type II toxin-antitoxin system PemK/MazF family toxin [Candidatus Saccharibacteria bacterium]|nr:type II toxin-antitoxin system PemK/MazF family toxin [Candidatus Saccharibacteria bacterium]